METTTIRIDRETKSRLETMAGTIPLARFLREFSLGVSDVEIPSIGRGLSIIEMRLAEVCEKIEEVSDRDFPRKDYSEFVQEWITIGNRKIPKNPLNTYRITNRQGETYELSYTDAPYVPADWDGKVIEVRRGESLADASQRAGYCGGLMKVVDSTWPDRLDKTIREVRFEAWIDETARQRAEIG